MNILGSWLYSEYAPCKNDSSNFRIVHANNREDALDIISKSEMFRQKLIDKGNGKYVFRLCDTKRIFNNDKLTDSQWLQILHEMININEIKLKLISEDWYLNELS